MSFTERLLQEMTLPEKIGQMTQLAIDTIHKGEPKKIDLPPLVDEEKLDYVLREKMVGSILNVPTNYLPSRDEWHHYQKIIQEKVERFSSRKSGNGQILAFRKNQRNMRRCKLIVFTASNN